MTPILAYRAISGDLTFQPFSFFWIWPLVFSQVTYNCQEFSTLWVYHIFEFLVLANWNLTGPWHDRHEKVLRTNRISWCGSSAVRTDFCSPTPKRRLKATSLAPAPTSDLIPENLKFRSSHPGWHWSRYLTWRPSRRGLPYSAALPLWIGGWTLCYALEFARSGEPAAAAFALTLFLLDVGCTRKKVALLMCYHLT